MIVKSMARKAPTFDQLIAYIGRDADADGTVFARNLHYDGTNPSIAARCFQGNYRHLPKRKNGNALYHEVIVLEPQPNLDALHIEEALHDLAEQYCALRAPEQLAWGRVHRNTAHPHIHLMISANAAGSPYRSRLTKAQFADIQRGLEGYLREAWPELRSMPVYDKARVKEMPSITRNEGEAVRRDGQPSRKQTVAAELRGVFALAIGKADLEQRLQAAGFTLYQRGRSWGVIDRKGRRYRLQTLGLMTSFARVLEQKTVERRSTHPAPDRASALIEARENAPAPRESQTPPPASPVDPRVAALLEARPGLDEIAREQLDDFERDQDSNR